jgi:DNA polymerase-1
VKNLIVIDGHAILHRAFHAYPPLNSPDGQVVNAVYGFFAMLLKIVDDIKPEYLIVCFDRPKPTFRKALYAGYQIKKVHDVLEQAGVSIFEVDGYEADDLIGTISRQAPLAGDVQVIIVSGDRDLLQLVTPQVKVLAPIVGVTKMILYDEKAVEEKYGLKPVQVIDYKALVGDASDNYPGVSGIGPKTASDLLQKYDTFENLYQHLSELPEKIALKLATDAEQAALAKKLATITMDAPITIDLTKCESTKVDKEKLSKSFEELGFSSLIKRFFEGSIIHDKKPMKKKEADHIKQLGLL